VPVHLRLIVLNTIIFVCMVSISLLADILARHSG